jgi:hypothetical protein
MNELTFFAGVTVLYTTLAMWATQPSYACVMIEEPPLRLYMDQEVHREHLARDARRIQQLARRYAAHAADISTEASDAERCLESLTRQLAATHDVPIDLVRAVISAER